MKLSLYSLLLLLLFSLLSACGNSDNASTSHQAATPKPKNTLELVFTYGSEKKQWITNVTNAFNAARHKTPEGKVIYVNAIPMGSGVSVEEVLTGKRQTHLISPASKAFITLGNADSQKQFGIDLVGETQDLVLSPVVIAMWKPMAEALGWGKKPLGWADILAMAKNEEGWKKYGYPQWGKFKFGHTHPEYSNSGLISVLAQTYAATGKIARLKLEDIQTPEVAQYIHDIQRAIVHYGRSTGFFGEKLMANGPGYLSAAVLYENMVIQSYDRKDLSFPLVAIYPKEGTFWSDHPVGIVQRDWVTDAHKVAAKVYLDYLLAKPQQEKAMQYGFRPGLLDIPLTTPFDTAHGIDPRGPQATLEVPKAKVMRAMIELWKQNKKRANIVLVIDTSGSMRGSKIVNARNGALQMLSMLSDDDLFSLMSFNNDLNWLAEGVRVGDVREQLQQRIKSLSEGGSTALYDAVNTSYAYLANKPHPDKISAIVVLSDGADSGKGLVFNTLLQAIKFDSEGRPIRVFPIGYGDGADMSILNTIADTTQAKAYQGGTTDIGKIFREISTFF